MDKDITEGSQDWSEMYRKYAGKWVALADDEETVIAADENLKRTVELSEKKGHPKPILHRVPSEVVTFMGYEISL